jgi:hypothetical protein
MYVQEIYINFVIDINGLFELPTYKVLSGGEGEQPT